MQMRKEQHTKGWNEIKTNDSWALFKIMGEFVTGFEKMSAIGPCVSIFGSARTRPGDIYYELAVKVAQKVAEAGYGIITGGGPGIMEAGKLIELGTLEHFRDLYGRAIAVTQKGDRIDYQFFADTTAANSYLDSLEDKTGVMVRNSNLEDIFVELTGKQLN